MGRCKATNLCAYCARLSAVENAEMLALDAVDGRGPSVYVVLTTGSTVPEQDAHEEGRKQFVRELRAVLGRQVEYASLLEFSTGRGERSGGARRPHWNLTLKGVGPGDVPAVRAAVERTWCRLEDADPKAQFVGPITEVGGLMRYLALHFQKQDQSPPVGWRGKRFNCSLGYFGGSTVRQARQRARESLRWKRELWRNGGDGQAATATLEASARLVWVYCTDRGARLSGVQYVAAARDAELRRDRSWRPMESLDVFRLLLKQLERDAEQDEVEREIQQASLAERQQGLWAFDHDPCIGKRSGPR